MNALGSEEETIAAISTPTGAGAIGIVRVSGPKTIEILSPLICLKNGLGLNELPTQKISFGYFYKEKEKLDQVTVALFRAPNSYTGEDLLEIYCHGSPSILKEALNAILEKGARLANPGELTQRSFLNGKLDLAQAEAVADLIRSKTDLSRRVALSQLEGDLSRQLSLVRSALIEILAHLEVGIDHSDDPTSGVPMVTKAMAEKLKIISGEIQSLIDSYSMGRLLQEGIRICLIGKPNVGKSSLLNRLLRSDRAIVTEIPGTTRDTIEESFNLFGLTALLVDTAGIREGSKDQVERIGMDRTLKSIESADLVLLLLDGSQPLSKDDQEIASLLNKKEKVLIALNKNDLLQKLELPQVKKLFEGKPILSISTLENKGIETLLQKLYKMAVPSNILTDDSTSETLITSLRHKESLSSCHNSLLQALHLCQTNADEECLAVELRCALDAVGEIVGEVSNEDILGDIFSKFCIGK